MDYEALCCAANDFIQTHIPPYTALPKAFILAIKPTGYAKVYTNKSLKRSYRPKRKEIRDCMTQAYGVVLDNE